MSEVFVTINGVTRDVSGLDMSNADRFFRDAWTLNGNAVEIDLVKAKEIKAEKLYQEQLGLETKAAKDAKLAIIKADKAFTDATTVEAVKAVKPLKAV